MQKKIIILAATALTALALNTLADQATGRRQPHPPTSRPPAEFPRKTQMPTNTPPPRISPADHPVSTEAAEAPASLSGYIVFVAGILLLFRKTD